MFKGSVAIPLLSSFLQAFRSTKASTTVKNCFKCFILINLVRSGAIQCEPHGQLGASRTGSYNQLWQSFTLCQSVAIQKRLSLFTFHFSLFKCRRSEYLEIFGGVIGIFKDRFSVILREDFTAYRFAVTRSIFFIISHICPTTI